MAEDHVNGERVGNGGSRAEPVTSLPPIPTPFAQRWNELRVRLLAPLVFISTVAVLIALWVTYLTPKQSDRRAETNGVSLIDPPPTRTTNPLTRPLTAQPYPKAAEE
jgi:hypothetical protein